MRYLCPQCRKMRAVAEVQNLDIGEQRILLQCGHTRPLLLPSRGVSLELMASETAKALFPRLPYVEI